MNLKRSIRIGISIFVFAVALWGIVLLIISFINKEGLLSTDNINIANSFISALAFIGVVVALHLQYKSYEISKQQHEFEKLIDIIKNQISGIDNYIDSKEYFAFQSMGNSVGKAVGFDEFISFYSKITEASNIKALYFKSNNYAIIGTITFLSETIQFLSRNIEMSHLSTEDKHLLRKYSSRLLKKDIIKLLEIATESDKYGKQGEEGNSDIETVRKKFDQIKNSYIKSIVEFLDYSI